MQNRHQNRQQYFRELALTSENYFMPYIGLFIPLKLRMNILEIGCGDGGNLLPFARMGCHVVGVDIADCRILQARSFFKESHVEAEFITSDFFQLTHFDHFFDLIICHDVFEHILDKELFLSKMEELLKPEGMVFMSFPAWQMPFGGHQQICRSQLLSHLPFVHLLPGCFYEMLIKACGEKEECIHELMEIKTAGFSIELFEQLIQKSSFVIEDKLFWLINPHYKIKFGWKPRKLNHCFSSIPYLRNYLCSSCFYMLKLDLWKVNRL